MIFIQIMAFIGFSIIIGAVIEKLNSFNNPRINFNRLPELQWYFSYPIMLVYKWQALILIILTTALFPCYLIYLIFKLILL